jgi:hypothetical protein
LTDRSGTKHGEASLHHEDKGTGEKKEEGVDTVNKSSRSFGELQIQR